MTTNINAVTFKTLNLIEPICRSLETEGYLIPTPIQEQSIPHLLTGGDLLGCAQTGTGKTAAFALPMLQQLSSEKVRLGRGEVRSLILTPTRELAIQIGDSFAVYGRHLNLRHLTIFGGVSEVPQIRALKTGADVLIATPGRLLDLVQRHEIELRRVEIFVLDEADRMLDMGFIRDVKKILPLIPKKRQTLLFSATMPDEVRDLAMGILNNPKCVAVAAVSSTADRIDEQVMFVEKENKRDLLLSVLKDPSIKRALVFTRTKHGANRLSQSLDKSRISSSAIHGNKSQGARQRALEDFRSHKIRVLVATDIFARGIDIDDITHVINYELPNVPESYVHRIGRTARAGTSGVAISFCDHEERAYLRDIEKMLNRPVVVIMDQPFHSESVANSKGSSRPQPTRNSRSGRPGGRPNNARPNNSRPNSNRGPRGNSSGSGRNGNGASRRSSPSA